MDILCRSVVRGSQYVHYKTLLLCSGPNYSVMFGELRGLVRNRYINAGDHLRGRGLWCQSIQLLWIYLEVVNPTD